MKTILILNHTVKGCGVYNFGKRFYDLASRINSFNIIYREITTKEEYFKIVSELSPDIIIYNWHTITMGWLTEDMIMSDKTRKHWFIYHDEVLRTNYDKYLFFGGVDANHRIPIDRSLILPRPLMEYKKNYYPKNDVVTIGSFGFPFWHKGFHTLVEFINKNMDKAVINLLTPINTYVDHNGETSKSVIRKCRELNTNPNVTLNICSDFIEEQSVLEFLAKNDINVFLYTHGGDSGISSSTDYALSVKRPIAVSNSGMFRHILNPDIIFDNNLTTIIDRGIEPLQKYYDMWKPENFIAELEKGLLDVQ